MLARPGVAARTAVQVARDHQDTWAWLEKSGIEE